MVFYTCKHVWYTSLARRHNIWYDKKNAVILQKHVDEVMSWRKKNRRADIWRMEMSWRRDEQVPACLGRALQLSCPNFWMYAISIISSAGVHGPFFRPTFTQHGALPFAISSNYRSASKLPSTRLPACQESLDPYTLYRTSYKQPWRRRRVQQGGPFPVAFRWSLLTKHFKQTQ